MRGARCPRRRPSLRWHARSVHEVVLGAMLLQVIAWPEVAAR